MNKKTLIIVNSIYATLAALFSGILYKGVFHIDSNDAGITQLFVVVFVYLILSPILAFISSKYIPRYFWLWPLLYFVAFFFVEIIGEIGTNFLLLFEDDNLISFIPSALFVASPSLLASFMGKHLSRNKN